MWRLFSLLMKGLRRVFFSPLGAAGGECSEFFGYMRSFLSLRVKNVLRGNGASDRRLLGKL